jgi:hypothetical protein
VFTARYALSPYIKQTRVVFKGLNVKPYAVCREGGEWKGKMKDISVFVWCLRHCLDCHFRAGVRGVADISRNRLDIVTSAAELVYSFILLMKL